MTDTIKVLSKLPSSRLSRKIVFYIFIAVIIIETIIFIPSFKNRQKELFAHLKEISSARVSLLIETTRSIVTPKELLNQSQYLLRHPIILGVALYQSDGKKLGIFGEPPELPFVNKNKNNSVEFLNKDNYRYDLAFIEIGPNRNYTLIVRHDTSSIRDELVAFFFRISGLVVIISLFVTAGAWLALYPIVVTPIIKLRGALLRAGEAISRGQEASDFYSDSVQRRDELGDVISAFKVMISQISDAINERKKAEKKLRESYQQIIEYSEALNRELISGQNMQKNFLPSHLIKITGWEFAAFFRPARQVSGDFYDVFRLSNGQVGLVIADICDKGVGAALFMALFRSLLRIFSGQFSLYEWDLSSQKSTTGKSHSALEKPVENPDKLQALKALKAVELTNNYISTNHGDLGMFATLFFGVLDPVTGSLLYINGGHEPLVIIGSSGGVKAHLRPTGPAVGVQAGLEYKVNEKFLTPGDILMGYTDGVPEAKSSSGEFFSKERLMSLLDKPVSSATRLIREIVVSVTEHMGEGDQYDDLTLVAVQRNIPPDSEDKI